MFIREDLFKNAPTEVRDAFEVVKAFAETPDIHEQSTIEHNLLVTVQDQAGRYYAVRGFDYGSGVLEVSINAKPCSID